ncbi:YejG family protein [Pectobacteriaceae bacterium CE90]|nr:YejG family protein [Pectobacteriaceae bacterium CE90]
MNSLQLSVVHRLPQSYRWLTGFTGVKVEPIPLSGKDDDNNLIGFKLLSHDGTDAWKILHQLDQYLDEIHVQCTVLEWDSEPCLFLHRNDESTALCHLKNVGVAIAESIAAQHPF